MTQRLYPFIFIKDRRSGYSARGVDLPDAITEGETLEQAMLNAQEVLALVLEGRVEDGEPIPEPSDLDAALKQLDAFERKRPSTVQFVPGFVPEPAVRVNVTLPGDLLKRIDAATQNRSAFLADAARKELAGGVGSLREPVPAYRGAARPKRTKEASKKAR